MTILMRRDWGPDRRWRYYWRALREWRRILGWRRRTNPANGRRYGTLDAWRSVIENAPTLDDLWDEMADRGDDCDACFGEGEVVTCFDDLCRTDDGVCIHGDGYGSCTECRGTGVARA